MSQSPRQGRENASSRLSTKVDEHGGPYISEGCTTSGSFQVSLRESSAQKKKSLSLFWNRGIEASLFPEHFAEERELSDDSIPTERCKSPQFLKDPVSK